LWLFLRDNTAIFPTKEAKTLLHFAPEPCLRKKFEKMADLRYIVSNLQSTVADEKIDITNIPLRDGSVDFIVCCHVLEHVPDDVKAMRELRRVLKPDGWAVINVPVDYSREQTYEDAAVTTPAQRKINFGQADHVRVYGRDYPLRLAQAGFVVKEIDLARELGRETVERHVLSTDEMIYFCTG
jgi:SAM-dependent methyltransferase